MDPGHGGVWPCYGMRWRRYRACGDQFAAGTSAAPQLGTGMDSAEQLITACSVLQVLLTGATERSVISFPRSNVLPVLLTGIVGGKIVSQERVRDLN